MTTDEFKEILDVSTKFAGKEIGPGALEADLHPSIDWTKSLWTKSLEVGFPGLLIPEDYRGFGQSALCGALVLDTLASECAGAASVFAHHFAACTCIMAGNKKQKETYLPLLANSDTTGPIIGTVVFLPYLDDNRLTLSEKTGKLTLSGTSQLTGNVLLARYFCVFLDEGTDKKNITCIIIDKNTPGVKPGDSAGFTGLKLNPFAPIIFEEVEVDPETGEIHVTRVVNVNDVGKVINRMSCEGQQYGGSIMGISRGKFEEVVHDPVTGVMLNGNLIDYKVATIKDVCPIDTVLVESGMGYGPYGLIGIGEDVGTVVPGLLVPAVFNAIGVWIDEFPITPAKVLKALGKISA